MPRTVVDRLNSEVNKIIKAQATWRKSSKANGVSAAGGNRQLLYEQILREIEQWRKVVTAAGVKSPV